MLSYRVIRFSNQLHFAPKGKEMDQDRTLEGLNIGGETSNVLILDPGFYYEVHLIQIFCLSFKILLTTELINFSVVRKLHISPRIFILSLIKSCGGFRLLIYPSLHFRYRYSWKTFFIFCSLTDIQTDKIFTEYATDQMNLHQKNQAFI